MVRPYIYFYIYSNRLKCLQPLRYLPLEGIDLGLPSPARLVSGDTGGIGDESDLGTRNERLGLKGPKKSV